MMRRFNPKMQHFQVARPLRTHWRKATCAEVRCKHYMMGWVTIVPTTSEAADFIRYESGRHFTEKRAEGGMSEFTFPPGQECWRSFEHRIQVERPPLYGLDGLEVDSDLWLDELHEATDVKITEV